VERLTPTSVARLLEGSHIVFEHGLEWLLVRPFRMLNAISRAGSPDFVQVPQRIATFDNDGTLWCEQPM
jgi:hypothetical protein